jgi:hypothetical protein
LSLITTDSPQNRPAECGEVLAPDNPATANTRELVVEVESVRRVRKRSTTMSLYCKACRTVSEFVSMSDASALFEVQIEQLAEFIETNNCHLKRNANGGVYLCLISFVGHMRGQDTADHA